jgi:hypothetical protein
MNEWPFWMFEENIKIINQINQEEYDRRKKIEEEKSNKKEITLKK